MPVFQGTSDNDTLNGSAGDDTLFGNGGQDKLHGLDGDDLIIAIGASGLTGLNGHDGNDTLIGSVPGSGQIHMRGGAGDDTLVLDLTNSAGHQGHHVYGGTGADRFEFVNVADATAPILGRIDDFDPARDSLWLNGTQLDLSNLPSDVSIVLYLGQQWLKIGDSVLYALQGARDGGNEQHFSPFPSDINALPQVEFTDQVNFVPVGLYQSELGALNQISRNQPRITGTDTADLISAEANESVIIAGDGNDVVDAGKGDDTVLGGLGDDRIAGGMDNDILRGDAGRDTLFGGSENDTLYGGLDEDHLHGGTGDDRLVGNAGQDHLWGDHGRDTLAGHSGDDQLFGGAGDDQLFGQLGHDILQGGAGNDQLFGAVGDDDLRGGAGADHVWGGSGADRFIFAPGDLVNWNDLRGTWAAKNAQLDLIADFVVGTDTIVFDGITSVTSRADLRCWQTTLDGNLHYTVQIRDTKERILLDVADGTGWSDFFADTTFEFG